MWRNDFKLKELSGESNDSLTLAEPLGGDFGEDDEDDGVCFVHAKSDGLLWAGGEGVRGVRDASDPLKVSLGKERVERALFGSP